MGKAVDRLQLEAATCGFRGTITILDAWILVPVFGFKLQLLMVVLIGIEIKQAKKRSQGYLQWLSAAGMTQGET